MTSEPDLESYLSDLKELTECGFQHCDKKLLQLLLDSFSDLTSKDLHEKNKDKEIYIGLFLEDMHERKGPYRMPCVPSWTGKTMKEKIFEFFKFQIECQILLANSQVVADEQTLHSAGIVQPGDSISVFLKKARKVAQSSDDLLRSFLGLDINSSAGADDNTSVTDLTLEPSDLRTSLQTTDCENERSLNINVEHFSLNMAPSSSHMHT